jgi:hypothetical protein
MAQKPQKINPPVSIPASGTADILDIEDLYNEATSRAPLHTNGSQPVASVATMPQPVKTVCATQPTGKYTRPTVCKSGRQLDELARDAIDAIVAYNQNSPHAPILYVRGGLLVYLCTDENGNMIARQVTPAVMLRILADVAIWTEARKDKKGNLNEYDAQPTAAVAGYILSMAEWPMFPTLAGIVSGPIFTPEGLLHAHQGYSAQSKFYNAAEIPIGDTAPTPANMAAARALIMDDLLVDFPFVDQASRANAVALLLLPFVRQLVHGQTPMHLIDAPDAGTGKGLLADLLGIVATGQPLDAVQACRDDDEWRKRISAALLMGNQHLFIDNIPQGSDFGSGALASALTQEFYTDRLLGTNDTIRIRVRSIWCASGNNVVPTTEIARRCVWIRLDANAERPHERTGFKHPFVRNWAQENRGALVTAVITLINAWMLAGRPDYDGKLLGSYEKWTTLVGGLLQHIGIGGFLGNHAELMQSGTSDHAPLAAFVEEWFKLYGQTETESGKLFKIASYPDDDRGNLVDDRRNPAEWLNILSAQLGSGKQQSRSVKLGNLLKKYKDRVISGCKIQQCTVSGGSPRWRLLKIED